MISMVGSPLAIQSSSFTEKQLPAMGVTTHHTVITKDLSVMTLDFLRHPPEMVGWKAGKEIHDGFY